MDPKAPGGASLLRELRRVEWRRLLLVVALLSAWGRALVPMPAHAAPVSPEAILCSAAAMAAGISDTDGTGPEAPRACPLCRLSETPAGLLALPPAAAAPTGPERVFLAADRSIPRFAAAPWHKLPRGPPERATTH
jgi:hypothetical protein